MPGDGGGRHKEEATDRSCSKIGESRGRSGLGFAYGGNLVDTLDADYEDELGFGINVEASLLFTQAVKPDLFALRIAVFLDVFLGALENNTTFFLVGLWVSEVSIAFD